MGAAPYGLYGVAYVDPVSLAPFAGVQDFEQNMNTLRKVADFHKLNRLGEELTWLMEAVV